MKDLYSLFTTQDPIQNICEWKGSKPSSHPDTHTINKQVMILYMGLLFNGSTLQPETLYSQQWF